MDPLQDETFVKLLIALIIIGVSSVVFIFLRKKKCPKHKIFLEKDYSGGEYEPEPMMPMADAGGVRYILYCPECRKQAGRSKVLFAS